VAKLRLKKIGMDLRHRCPSCECQFLAEKAPRGKIRLHFHEPEMVPINQNPLNPGEAWLELDLPTRASGEEIRRAYRQQCQLFHPDKVASLGPELKRVAEAKMKRINAAYELLQK
jgi:DnaJ-domain-containing protein 1